MLWPIILPFQLTCALVAASLIIAAVVAQRRDLRLARILGLTFGVSLIAFVPACVAIGLLVDQFRFGEFEYDSVAEINDFRAKRYLPPAATAIRMHKHHNGYLARYSLAEAGLEAYLDGLWQQYEALVPPQQLYQRPETRPVEAAWLARAFADVDWALPAAATVHEGPREGDGGGASYYADRETGLVYQRTAYW